MAISGVKKKVAHFKGTVNVRSRNLQGTNFSVKHIGPKAKGR